MPRGLAPSEKREYVQRYYEEKEEEPTPTLQLAPKPAPTPTEMPPFVGPKTGRIHYQAQPTTKEEAIEREIMSVYKQAPIVEQPDIYARVRGGKVPTQQVYAPTPKQEEQIISLAMQLPPEKRAKYLVEPPSWKETTVTGAIYREGEKTPVVGVHLGGSISQDITMAFSGFVGVFESWLRPEVPSPTGAVVGLAVGRPQQFQAYREELHAGYLVGGLFGTYVEAKAMGFAAKKVWAGIKVVTPEFIKHPIYQTVKFGRVAKLAHQVKLAAPSFRGSRLDVFLTKHSKWYYRTTRGIAHGEVAIPRVTERISLGQLKASMGAWELTQAPRTGGVWIGKVAIAPIKTKVLPHLISRGGLVSIGFLREVSYDAEPYWRRGLLPFVTQQQVTRLGLIPYVPKIVSTTGKKGVSMLGAGLALTVPKLVVSQVPKLQPRKKMVVTPKVWQPTLAYEREKIRPLTLLEPKVKQRERLVPTLRLPQIQEQPQAPTLKIPTLQIPTLDIPTPQVPKLDVPTYPLYPRVPRGGRDVSRGARGLFGTWFKREHKVASPKEVASRFFGERKPRKKKRKGKRRKGGVLLRF